MNDTPDLEERVKALSDLYGAPNPRETRPSIMAFWNPPAEEVVSLAEIRALRDAADPVFVYLHGRSTAYSVGVLHDVDAIVRTHYARRDDDDDDSDSVPVVSSELVVRNCHAPMPVVAPRLRLPPGPCGVFAGPGDAGAPVRLADGRLVGFVLQGDRASGAGGHVCHVTPAETVLEHVKRVTGAEEVKVVPCWGEGSEVSPGGE